MTKMTNPESEHLIYLNALNMISFFGTKRLTLLLEHFGTARNAWEATSGELVESLGLKQKEAVVDEERKLIDPEREWSKLIESDIGAVSTIDPEYPELLKEIPYPPSIIYYRGSLEKANQPAVALVGSRRCTFYGKEVSGRIAAELAAEKVTVVSGMALGIDTAAHKGALENSGYTVAVLGCSLDKCYPPQNRDLMGQIMQEGLVVSEYAAGTEPLPMHFPQRNRIISGLSLGTLVIEATAKSGALITANYALEQNREVFAVPGNVGSPYSRGCHRLIKEGAGLVESAADILDQLYIGTTQDIQLSIELTRDELSEAEKKLLQIIPYQPMHMDNIIQQGGMKASEVSTFLLSLELKKYIRQTPGKYFCRT